MLPYRAGEHLRAYESCADLVQSVCAEVSLLFRALAELAEGLGRA